MTRILPWILTLLLFVGCSAAPHIMDVTTQPAELTKLPPLEGTVLSEGMGGFCYGHMVYITDYDLNGDKDVDVRVYGNGAIPVAYLLFVPTSNTSIGGYVADYPNEKVHVYTSLDELLKDYPDPCELYLSLPIGDGGV